MKKFLGYITILIFSLSLANGTDALWQGKGRIAISSDGNDHDDDDWAATPMSLAILAAKGLQDKLCLYTYSDHIWGNATWRNSYEQMNESALVGAEMFGFDKSRFICAVDNPQKAYLAMKEQIDKSSKKDPLFIIAAGPMEVVGQALELADVKKLKYVSVISHSWWNNEHGQKHDALSFNQIVAKFFKKGVRFFYISDQNGKKNIRYLDYEKKIQEYEGLAAEKERFDWIKTSPARALYKEGSWDWLYSRLESCQRKPNAKNKKKSIGFDCSDSGMLIYLFSGDDKTNVDMLKQILENPVKNLSN